MEGIISVERNSGVFALFKRKGLRDGILYLLHAPVIFAFKKHHVLFTHFPSDS